MKDSHEYAAELSKLAAQLLARPAFPMEWATHCIHIDTREQLKSAVKALGSGKKEHGTYSFNFHPAFLEPEWMGHFHLSAAKNVVCRKVQDEVWECDPVFEAGEAVADEAAA